MEALTDTRQNWVDSYAERILHTFDKWQSPLGGDPEYRNVVKEQLEGYYGDPLKKSLIETSYPEDQ
jgi:hypothetical protein